ncbi:MAG: TrmH family RNA methyltransferase, partial [Pseudomonadota bacterium]
MLQAPAIILSAPQMHENIGAAARAMANFSLSRLCLIAPRDGPPSEKAYAMASRADHILDDAVIHGDFAGAISDFQFIIAT